MIVNILVLAGIILIVVAIVAYNSKRQVLPTKCGCGKSVSGYCDNSHAEQAVDTPANIISDNEVNTAPSGSFEYIKEHI